MAIMQGRQKAAEDRHDEAISLAWHAEAISRNPKLPRLSKLLARKAAPRDRQSPDDMLASFRAFQSAGAPMTIRRIA